MADSSQASAIRATVDRLLALPGPFTRAAVAAACATELREISCANIFMQEFVGHPSTGPFDILTLRIPQPHSPASLHLTALTVRSDVIVGQDELRGYFTMSRHSMLLEPRTPPEGVVSFRTEIADTMVFLDLRAKTRTLTTVALHRHESGSGAESAG